MRNKYCLSLCSPQRSDSEGTVQLDGEGYAAVGRPTRWNPNVSTITFKFRTFSSEALLMYLATEDMVRSVCDCMSVTYVYIYTVYTDISLWFFCLQKDFLSLELSEGKVKVNFDLGSGVGSAISTNRHNDGSWKSITMARNKKQSTSETTQQSWRSWSEIRVGVKMFCW